MDSSQHNLTQTCGARCARCRPLPARSLSHRRPMEKFFLCVCVCVFLLFVDCLNFLMAILKKKRKKKKIKLSFYGGKMGGNSNEKMKDLK